MNVVAVNLTGIAIIVLVIWWFWLSEPKAQRALKNVVDILVEGGTYTPPRVEVEVGREVTLRFLRKDPRPCAEKVVFEQFGISADLPINAPKEIVVAPTEPGEYSFTCQMQMYRGSIVAK